jgi:purine-nucleoside phosphorylase
LGLNDDIKDLYENKKCLCVEMESFALFHNANIANKKASCILTISDSLVTHEELSSHERQTGFDEMITLALESILD